MLLAFYEHFVSATLLAFYAQMTSLLATGGVRKHLAYKKRRDGE